ncbi:MAG: hypothetical protein K2K85_07000 [Clostridia bacterium]|nr:hypothetical protein [Clostridia bacterium]
MAHQPGGETEKLGNFYEDNVLIHYYGQMLEGKYLSVMSESFDSDLEKGGDIYLCDNDNKTTVIQVKSRHGNDDVWDISTLIKIGVIKNACHHILQGRTFILASPLSFMLLQDLCRHAMSFDNYADFQAAVLRKNNAQELIKLETEIKKYFVSDDIIKFFKSFSLIRFDDDLDKFVRDFRNSIKSIDDGHKAFQLLRQYPIKHNKLSQEIYADELWRFLSDKGIKKYDIDEPTATRQIHDLCNEYKTNINRKLINQTNYKRKEFDELISKISNRSITIIHGKAGCGKSGIIAKLCEHLEKQNELYLPLSLDARMPSGCTHEFGKQLGLSASPVLTLSKLANQRIGYLIIDQMDAIRWNVTHSTSAFSVCCELVQEAQYCENVKIIFVCRTIDAEKVLQLFNDSPTKLTDCSIVVGPLTDSEVQNIIGGQSYYGLTPNVKKMLTNINNLKMFMTISNGTHIDKSSDIIREYINKKLDEIANDNEHEISARKLLQYIINKMCNLNTQVIARNEIENEFGNNLLEKFCSCGITEEINSSIRFTHQSILDYYLAQELENEIAKRNNVVKVIKKHNKTAIIDYDILKQYFEFVELNSSNYAKVMEKVLFSSKICSFIRHIALESFRTTSHDDVETIALALKILTSKKYGKKYLLYLTIGNYAFAHGYIESANFLELKKSTTPADQLSVIDLLFYANNQCEQYLAHINDYIKIVNYDTNVVEHLYHQIDDTTSSDKMFELKIGLLSHIPNQKRHIYWDEVFSLPPSRAGMYIKYSLSNNDDYNEHFDWSDHFETLLNIVKLEHQNYLCAAKDYLIRTCKRWELDGYDDFKYHFIKAMAKNLLEASFSFSTPNEILDFLYSPYQLFKNIALQYMTHCNTNNALCVFERLIDDNYISKLDFRKHKAQLGSLRDIVKNHSSNLNADYLNSLIKQIKSYKSPSLITFAKDRFEQRKKGLYYHFFEEEQKILLSSIPHEKLNNSTCEYLKYLLRKFPAAEYYYSFSDYMIGEFRSVVSGIIDKWPKFSIKTWKRLLTNPKTGNRKFTREEINASGNYVEYDRSSFVQAISTAASIKQTMFAEIALKSNNIPRYFINAICSGISGNEKDANQKNHTNEIVDICDVNIRLEVFKKYYDITNKEFLHSLIKFIEHNDIFDTWIESKLIEIAQNSEKYETEIMNVWHADWDANLDSLTINDLETEKINRVQTCAITVLANNLYVKKCLDSTIKNIIDECYESSHPVLLLSAIDLICPIWNFDKQYAIDIYTKILKKDMRTICGYKSINLLDRAAIKYPDNFSNILSEAITTGKSYLKTIGSRIVYYYCYYGIYENLIKQIIKTKPKLIISCCTDIIKNNNADEKIQNRTKKLLLSIESKSIRTSDPNSLRDIILDSDKDSKFTVSIIKKMLPLEKHEWYGILSDLNDLDCLSKQNRIVYSICDNVISQQTLSLYEIRKLVDVVVKLYAELYDSNENRKLKQCLKRLNKIYDTFVIDTIQVANIIG